MDNFSFNPASAANHAKRLRFMLQSDMQKYKDLFNQGVSGLQSQARDVVDGKFGHGSFQMNAQTQSIPCARAGIPSSGSMVCP